MSIYVFFERLPYTPDPFQVEAAEAVEAGESVVVTAPTGAGKTLVAEAAVHHALHTDRRAIYTTPLKALSNQKYGDFVRSYGGEAVGLLTGDNSVNGRAPIVVMTTEVLRNMIYAGSEDLRDVGIVVLDEVHYLQDRFRGAVWEEVIIHAPPHMQMVALSATISNAGEFSDWLRERRGPTRLVIEEHRPVPLESLWAVKDLHRGDDGLIIEPLLVERRDAQTLNPEIVRILRRERGRRRRFATPRRLEVVQELVERSMLPAIYFIFSRAGCSEAAASMLHAGLRLTTLEERSEIRERALERTSHLAAGDLDVLEFDDWLAQLEAGVAAHHAGLVPAFKEAVEELFAKGLVKVVFATETLSLGINMPARTTVLDKLSKFTGETHELLLPGEYTQLTGRAGRRGIDTRGYGVVLHSPYVQLERIAEIVRTGSHALRSSFRPTYNMAVNLVANYERDRAEELLRASFAQFQLDRAIRRLQKAVSRTERKLEQARADAVCELGPVEAASTGAAGAGSRRIMTKEVEGIQVGHVLDVPGGRRTGRYLITAKQNRKGGPSFSALTPAGERVRLRSRDIPPGTEVLGRMRVPRPFPPSNPEQLVELAEEVAAVDSDEPKVLGSEVIVAGDAPAAACPDLARHQAAARRVRRLERELERQRRRLQQQGEGLVGELRRVIDLLVEWGYVDGWSLTDRGAVLRFIYNELDVLVVEAVERGLFDRLTSPELAAFASSFVFEPRADESDTYWPTPELEDAWGELVALWRDLAQSESSHDLPASRPPEAGFAALAYHWANGVDLDDLLDDSEMAAGDFVRTCRQLLDLLRQVRDAVPDLAAAANDAIKSVDRGVVAAGGIG